MRCSIARPLLERIGAEASASPDVEVCGLLLGESGRITEVRACRNVAEEPTHRFEIDPGALLAAHRAARAGGPVVIGCYHSHPSGLPEPSARDAADAAPDGMLWLIVGGSGVRLWQAVGQAVGQAVDGGRVHGRFLPVALDVCSCCTLGTAGPKSAATSSRESS